jgi:hypothetical protein
MLANQQFGIAAADEAEVEQCVGVFAHLAGASRKKNDRDIAAGFDLLHHFIEVVAYHEAAAYKEIVHPGLCGQPNQLIGIAGLYFIGVYKNRKAFVSRRLALYQCVVNRLLHAEVVTNKNAIIMCNHKKAPLLFAGAPLIIVSQSVLWQGLRLGANPYCRKR